jgi:hypothetical protein
MPAFAQQAGRLSPDDQGEFDKHPTKWVNDTRKNDRDGIAKDVKHMRELTGRNGIRPMCLMRGSPVRAMNIQPAHIKATEVRIALTSFLQYEPMKLASIFSAPSMTVAAKSYAF